jgi:hypothetical protein
MHSNHTHDNNNRRRLRRKRRRGPARHVELIVHGKFVIKF